MGNIHRSPATRTGALHLYRVTSFVELPVDASRSNFWRKKINCTKDEKPRGCATLYRLYSNIFKRDSPYSFSPSAYAITYNFLSKESSYRGCHYIDEKIVTGIDFPFGATLSTITLLRPCWMRQPIDVERNNPIGPHVLFSKSSLSLWACRYSLRRYKSPYTCDRCPSNILDAATVSHQKSLPNSMFKKILFGYCVVTVCIILNSEITL